MIDVWDQFIHSPQVFISCIAVLISVISLVLQYVLFRMAGSRIHVNLDFAYYEPENGNTFNYPVRNSKKDILQEKSVQRLNAGRISREVNYAEGIELLKITISNRGRFPASVSDITLGYRVYGREHKRCVSDYTFGLRPFLFNSKTVFSFPIKISGGEEVSLYYYYWDSFHDLQNENELKRIPDIRAYVKSSGKRKPVRSRNAISLNDGQSSTLLNINGKIPLRMMLSRYFFNRQSSDNGLKQSECYFFSIFGNISLTSRLLESYLAGQWPTGYSAQHDCLQKFFESQNTLFGLFYDGNEVDGRYAGSSQHNKNYLAMDLADTLLMSIERWKDRIDWSDILQPNLYKELVLKEASGQETNEDTEEKTTSSE